MSSSLPRKAMNLLGKVTLNDIYLANGRDGPTWLGAIDTVERVLIAEVSPHSFPKFRWMCLVHSVNRSQYPQITGISFSYVFIFPRMPSNKSLN